MPEDPLVVGIDLGGTHVSSVVLDITGNLRCLQDDVIDLSDSPAEIIRGKIIPTVRRTLESLAQEDRSRLKGIGIGLPGNIDSKMGVCKFSPNFKWHNVQIRDPLQETLHLPTFILNDVRSATLGEKHFGAGRGFSDFVCCALGTGIGGGVVARGELILGALEGAGEIGHITVDPDGPDCNCGNFGCMEALASGPGIARRARAGLSLGILSLLRDMVEDISQVTSETVHKAACQGDPFSLKIWEETGIFLGIGIANIVTILNPQRIILGGRVSRAMEFFLPALKRELNRRARMVPPDSTEIVPAGLGKEAGMVGAAALAMEKLGILK